MDLFSLSYWFTFEPPEVGGFIGTLVFLVFLAFLVLGIVARIATDRRRKERYVREMGTRLSNLLIIMGFMGVLLFFFSYENVHFFGARFWYLLWGVVVLVWAYYLYSFITRKIPAMRERALERRKKQRYLPKRKKR